VLRAVVITGPPGAGKSSVAGALHDMLGEAGVANALVEVDMLERSHPPLGRDRALLHLGALCASFHEHGYGLLVVTATAEDQHHLQGVLGASGAEERLVVRLEAPPELLEERIRAREPAGWPGLERLVEASRRLAQSMPSLRGVDLVYDTAGESAEALAARIAGALGWTASAGYSQSSKRMGTM
jgi:chloramphenicol 3-O-phosphotransferase